MRANWRRLWKNIVKLLIPKEESRDSTSNAESKEDMVTIIIDPGHGGLDVNGNYTTAPNKMYRFPNGRVAYEGAINRQIAKKVYDYFKNIEGVTPVYTVHPDDPTDLSLRKRVEFANKIDNALFLSIHNNAGGGTGGELYTSVGTTKSDDWASEIYRVIKPTYSEKGLRWRVDETDNDPDKEADFYVLINTRHPAVLMEYGFFDHKKDIDFIESEDFQHEVAMDTVMGTRNYLGL